MSYKPSSDKFGKKTLLSSVFAGAALFALFWAPASAQTLSSGLGPLIVGGNADDPAIWIHPTDPSKSVMFLSDKNSGIYVNNFSGTRCQHINFNTALNNIDTRKGFRLGSQTIDIVAANLRDIGKLAVLKINPSHNCSNDVLTVLAGSGSSGNSIQGNSYGFTLYRRPSDGTVYVFDKPKSSASIKQWKVDGSSGSIVVSAVRTISDVSIGVAEGAVADDALGFVYFAEEAKGVHKYNADPNASNLNRLSFFASADGISGDREGFALYSCNSGAGYLVLSSQGNSQFKVYDRQTNAFIKTFTASGASGTDGLDVSSFAAPGFPNGFLIIHNDPAANYFVYDWVQLGLTTCVNGGGGTTSPSPPSPPLSGTKPGDFNQDGKVDVQDLGIFLSNWNSTSRPPADINQDGKVDIVDLGILLSNWGN